MVLRFLFGNLMLLALNVTGQEITQQKWTPAWSVSVKGNAVEIDNLGDVYVVSNQGIIKHKSNGPLNRRASTKSSGNISSREAIIPVKNLVINTHTTRIDFNQQTTS